MQAEERPLGAAVAALGLSNKAVYADDEPPESDDGPGGYADGPDFAPQCSPSVVSGTETL